MLVANSTDRIRRFIVGLLFIGLTLVSPITAHAGAPCWRLLARLSLGRESRDSNLALDIAEDVNRLLLEKRENGRLRSLPNEDIVVLILRMAIENTYQHGSEDLHAFALSLGESRNERTELLAVLSGTKFPIDHRAEGNLEIVLDGANLIFNFKNKQLKPFPKTLEREFWSIPGKPGSDNLERIVPSDLRVGFRGLGYASGLVLEFINQLPLGSSVAWHADGKNVTFSLKINLSGP